MQTLIAYAFSAGPRPEAGAARAAWQREARERVERLDAGRWAHGPRFHESHSASAGLLLWESQASPSLWPAWCGPAPDGPDAPEVVVASIYAPLGYTAVTGAAPIERAPLVLADALVADPARMFDITPPFVLARLDLRADTLDLFTDVLGVGRLFELATPWGRVWSNRAAAALRFAGHRAGADEVGWAQSAVADEFFGAVTPYEGVRAIDAATRVHIDGRTGRRLDTAVDTVATWSQGVVSTPELRQALAEQAAAALRVAAASVEKLYGESPTVDLSGGRDSRLVAAAFLASGTHLRLNSHDAVPGDLATATELVRLLRERAPGTETLPHERPPEHLVRHRPTGGAVEPPPLHALASARRWHEYADGLRPCTFIAHGAPAQYDAAPALIVGGVGGELAHGFFYPADPAAFDSLPPAERLGRYATTVLLRQGPAPGADAQARADLLAHIRGVLGGIADRGFTDARALDVYYMRERLRRWGSTAERIGIVSPLLSPSFVAAALALTPQERMSHRLHRDIVRELIPAWADVPFFPADTPAPAASSAPRTAPPAARAARVLRLADAADAGEVASLLADPSTWGSAFDVPTVHRYWQESRAGTSTARQERVLRSVVWRGAFEDVLADNDGVARPVYRPAEPPEMQEPPEAPEVREAPTPPTPPASAEHPARTAVADPGSGARRAAGRSLRRHPVARALARTPAWRVLRATPLGERVRRALRR